MATRKPAKPKPTKPAVPLNPLSKVRVGKTVRLHELARELTHDTSKMAEFEALRDELTSQPAAPE